MASEVHDQRNPRGALLLGSGIALTRGQQFWILNAAGWFIYAWIDILLDYRRTLAEPRLLIFHGLAFGAGFLICVPMRYLYRAALRRSRALLRSLVVVIAVCVPAANLWHLCAMVGAVAVDPNVSTLTIETLYGFEWLEYLNRMWHYLWPLLAWSVLYYAITIWFENRHARWRTQQAERLARQAQLEALRYQVNPHFLFNALNSIRAMIPENPAAAREMVTDLAGIFRQTLSKSEQFTVSLREEMALVTRYLAIEERRFGERLRVTLAIDPATEEIRIPAFTIQPLVENAIKYGMQTSTIPLHVDVTSAPEGDRLRIEVVNTGSWVERTQDGDGGTGSGLENLTKRLLHAYGDRFRIERVDSRGRVRVTILLDQAELREE